MIGIMFFYKAQKLNKVLAVKLLHVCSALHKYSNGMNSGHSI